MRIRLDNYDCDATGQKVYENFEFNHWPIHKWIKRDITFIPNSDYSGFTIGVTHEFIDSIPEAPNWHRASTGITIDNIGDFTPDTMYNSQATPIETNARNGTICKNSILQLRSPYGNIADQHWYRGTTYLGSGESIQDTAKQAARYMLVVGHSDTCVRSVLVTDIQVLNNCQALLLPNAFSPNGDSKNDIWRLANKNNVLAAGIEVERVQVFNRWGNRVYQDSGVDFAWDGGNHTSDVYYYFITYTEANGATKKVQGHINLIR